MSYCRFRNTLGDLQDCVSALNEVTVGAEELSFDEKRAAKSMLQVCREYIDTFEEAFGDME